MFVMSTDFYNFAYAPADQVCCFYASSRMTTTAIIIIIIIINSYTWDSASRSTLKIY